MRAGRRRDRTRTGFWAGVLRLAAGHLCRAAQWLLSLFLALGCLLALLWAAAAGAVRLLVSSAVSWAWQLLAQAAWEALAHSWPALDHLPLQAAAANATTALPVLTYLPEVAWEPGEVQAWGSAWTWCCLALSAWRRHRSR